MIMAEHWLQDFCSNFVALTTHPSPIIGTGGAYYKPSKKQCWNKEWEQQYIGTRWRKWQERGKEAKDRKRKSSKCFSKKYLRTTELRKSCLGYIRQNWEKDAQRIIILELKCGKAPGTYWVFSQLLLNISSNVGIHKWAKNGKSRLKMKKCNDEKKREDQTSTGITMNIYYKLIESTYVNVIDFEV